MNGADLSPDQTKAEAEALRALVTCVARLEDGADGPLTLEEVQAAVDDPVALARARAGRVLLVDHRQRLEVATRQSAPVVLCRLNRQHPLVRDAAE